MFPEIRGAALLLYSPSIDKEAEVSGIGAVSTARMQKGWDSKPEPMPDANKDNHGLPHPPHLDLRPQGQR